MNIFKPALLAIATLTLAACGGSSSTPISSTDINVPDNNIPDNTPPTNTTNVLTGRVVDSAVAGLQFDTNSQSGRTNTNGEFTYLSGENVSFSIGDITLPAVAAAELLTPLSIFSTTNIGDVRVINLARLLQTLDTDATPENGITISDAAHASATGLSVDFASAGFDAQVGNLVANSGSTNVSLVEGEPALDHLQDTLVAEGVVETPPANIGGNTDTSGNTSNNSKVGNVSTFSSFAHDVGGTVTVIDDRTLQVTNFTYDGGGPSVFFYTGVDGDYTGSPGSGIIGPELSGRAFNNETITLTLPDGLTLDDFNSISVWCDIFFADFGHAPVI